MNIQLIDYTKLSNAVIAGRTAWQSFHKGGQYFQSTDYISEVDREFLERIALKNKHESIIEPLVYIFDIKGISRACLQELARHRIASYTVKSTRYTLKELKKEEQFNNFDDPNDKARASKYLVWTTNRNVDITSFFMLEDLRQLINEGISNDIAKFALPESYKTSLIWTINARSLRNFLELRTSSAAMWEIRKLANAVYDEIPMTHKFLFKECVNELDGCQ